MHLILPEHVTLRLLGPDGVPWRCADLVFSLRIVVSRGQSYELSPFPTDGDGVARITRAELEDEIKATIEGGDDRTPFAPLDECGPEMEITLRTPLQLMMALGVRREGYYHMLLEGEERWGMIGNLVALYERALVATRRLGSLELRPTRVLWAAAGAQVEHELRLG